MSLFRRASQVRKKFKVCYYGGTGTGKTLSALTFPKLAYIDMEGGVDWYIGRQIIPEQNTDFLLLQTESAADVIKAVDEIESIVKKDPDEIQSVAVDPVSILWDALQEAFLRRLHARDKNAEIKFQHWKAIKAPYKRVITKLINLPVHLILVGRESSKYKMERGQLVEDGVTIQTEKDTPYISDIFVRFYKDRENGRTRFMAEVEKDRTNMMTEGEKVENLTFPYLLKLAEEKGLLDSIRGSKTRVEQDVQDVAEKDAVVFEESEKKADLQEIISSDEAIKKLWTELGWKPGKVLAMANRDGLTTREEVGKFLAEKVRAMRAEK